MLFYKATDPGPFFKKTNFQRRRGSKIFPWGRGGGENENFPWGFVTASIPNHKCINKNRSEEIVCLCLMTTIFDTILHEVNIITNFIRIYIVIRSI